MRKHETAVCGTARTVVWEVGKCENRRQMPFMTRIYLLPESVFWGGDGLALLHIHLFWKVFFRKPTRPSLPLRKAPPFTPALSPQERGSNRPTRYSEPLRSKVGGTKRSSPVRVGIGRKGSLCQQLIIYDFLSA